MTFLQIILQSVHEFIKWNNVLFDFRLNVFCDHLLDSSRLREYCHRVTNSF